MVEIFSGFDETGRPHSARQRAWLAGQFAGKAVEQEVAGRLSQATLTTTIGAEVDARVKPMLADPNDAAVRLLIEDKESATATVLSSTIDTRIAEQVGIRTTSDDVIVIGDSLTQSTGFNWPETILEPLLGVDVVNFGRAGWASTDIAVRAGAVRPKLTLAGNTIPASGPVTVTAINPAGVYRMDGTGALSWTGTLADVPGTLRHDMGPDTWTFTRTDPGAAVPVPAGTEFVDPSADGYRDRTFVLWAGRNNSGVMDPAIRDTDLMIRHQAAGVKRALVLGVINATTEYGSNAIYQAILRFNRLAAARYPDFLDIRRWLIDNGLQVAGVTPTAKDRGDIGNDAIPTSLHLDGDSLHLNEAGYRAVAQAVRQHFAVRGWIPGLVPVEKPAQVTGLTVGTPTDTTLAASWAAVAGALSYMVEMRPATGGAWLFATVATGTTTTLAGLSLGTQYEVRVTAYNAAGAGSSSATVKGTTTGTAAAYLTSDSFNRADVASIHGTSTDAAAGGTPAVWATTGGQVAVISNRVGRLDTSSTRYATVDAGVTDHRVRLTLAVTPDTAEVSLAARFQDPSNMYRALLTFTGAVSLRKVIGGTTTTIDGLPDGTINAGDVVALSVVGSTLRFYINGVLMLTATDTALTTGTRAGFSLPGSTVPRVDDFAVLDG